jgi:hypothetical protein
MLWSQVLTNWKNGIVMKYPIQLKDRFHWNTSVLKNDGNVEYKESFMINHKLPEIQNTKDFQEYIKRSKNKYVTVFPNLSKDTILVIPIPVNGKNYTTLKDFIDNAPEIQQKKFWKKVAQVSEKVMNKDGKAFISVHGLGVPYTHIRISSIPKYYFDNELKKE